MTRSSSSETGALVLGGAAPASASADDGPRSAKALESRLYAPCCYGGTLDIHDSPVAQELRVEIEQRLRRGEATEAIQADLVERYGPKVLAAKSDAPILAMAGGVLFVLLGALILLARVLRRWTREPIRAATPSRSARLDARDAELDARIDAELADLDVG